MANAVKACGIVVRLPEYSGWLTGHVTFAK